jgi:hypothetical protein
MVNKYRVGYFEVERRIALQKQALHSHLSAESLDALDLAFSHFNEF